MKKISKLTFGQMPLALQILLLALVLAVLLAGVWMVFNLAPFAP